MRLQNTPGVHIAGAYSRVVVLTNARTKLTRWRRYGTTDIILGGVDGTSSITSNDFNRRGEYLLCTIYMLHMHRCLHANSTYKYRICIIRSRYEGGPDGCAIDFETSSSGVRVDGGLRLPAGVRS